MSESSPSQTRAEKVVSFLIASVTVLAAIITALETYASGRKAEADRLSSQFAVEAMQTRASGQARVSYERQGAYRTWYELDLQALGATLSGDDAAAGRYRAVRDQITRLSPVFGSAYFDPASGADPDMYKYEADVYIVESTRLIEKFTAYKQVSKAWDSRANAFVVHLTLLAVTLALYGLSTTLRGLARNLFIGLGTFIAGLVVFWALVAMIQPAPVISDQAIDAYANGVGKAWYGDYDGAILDFDAAIASKPDYGNAFYERGNAKFSNAYYSGTGGYEAALADYESAILAGRDDISVGWNLGWTYYLVGRFDDAIEMDRLVLERDPSLLGARFNLALALLARGDFAEAEAEYQRGVDDAIHEITGEGDQSVHPPASFWYYLDAAAQDIDSLLLELDGSARGWSQAPNRSLIAADQNQIRDIGRRMFVLLRDTHNALELTGKPPPAAVTAQITPFQFALAEYDDSGNIAGYNIVASFPYGTNAIVVLFDHSGMVTGQSEVWKVYHNGLENPALRVISNWKLEASGEAAKSISYAYSNLFIFAPGEYTVELYIDYHLVQRGTFIVESQ